MALSARSDGENYLLKALLPQLFYGGYLRFKLHFYSQSLDKGDVPLYIRIVYAELRHIFNHGTAGALFLVEYGHVCPLTSQEARSGKSGGAAAHYRNWLSRPGFKLRFVQEVEAGVLRRAEVLRVYGKRALVKAPGAGIRAGVRAEGFDGERHRVAFDYDPQCFKTSVVFQKAHNKRNILPQGADSAALCLRAVHRRNGSLCLAQTRALFILIATAGVGFLFNVRQVGC